MKILASNCLFVEGFNKNLLIDLQNNNWYHIDFSKSELVSENLETETKEYLLRHGVLLDIPKKFVNNFENFSTQYVSAPHIESIIIDIDSQTEFNVVDVIQKFKNFNPMYLQLRYYCAVNYTEIEKILLFLNETTVECVEILMPFNQIFYNQFFEKNLSLIYSKFKRLIFHSTQESNKVDEIRNVFFSSEIIADHTNCGQVGYYNFSNNSNHVLKSINFNSCLYKKIGIDTKGNIKNCPSLDLSLGNILDNSIEHYFFETGGIKKDDIEVCMDCEFRYVCTDCRAYTDSKKRPNSRPSKCDYNPYISKWKHEEGFHTLLESGVVSNENEFSKDFVKIKRINDELLTRL